MSDKLKPCPFCGGEAEILRFGTGRYSTQYTCTECGANLETGETHSHGEAWNTRDTNTLKAEFIEKVRDNAGKFVSDASMKAFIEELNK